MDKRIVTLLLALLGFGWCVRAMTIVNNNDPSYVYTSFFEVLLNLCFDLLLSTVCPLLTYILPLYSLRYSNTGPAWRLGHWRNAGTPHHRWPIGPNDTYMAYMGETEFIIFISLGYPFSPPPTERVERY